MKLKSNKSYLFVVISAIITTFFIFNLVIRPVNFNNMGGGHMWLTGSTIKFTNMWLDEGAMNLKFTTYESFKSIEFNSNEERNPYVSYPTGTVLFTYSIAKICGLEHINVDFIKKLEFILYLIESILIGILIYLILSHLQIYNKWIISISAYISSLIYISLPCNNWYLLNVFYSDQLVLFFTTLFFLFEFLKNYTQQKHARYIINGLIMFTIFFGMIIDYYFWIIAFIAFLIEIISNIIIKDKGKRQIFTKSLIYIIPAILAVTFFIWQLSTVENGFNLMLERFYLRTGQDVSAEGCNSGYSIISKIIVNFYFFYGCGFQIMGLSVKISILLCVLSYIILTLVFFIQALIISKIKGIKNLILNPIIQIVILIITSTLLQLIILNQHTAVHEFSLLKVSQIFILIIPLLSYSFYWQKKRKYSETKPILFLIYMLFLSILFILASGNIHKSSEWYDRHNKISDFSKEESLRDNTHFSDVVFSFTYEIPLNPPLKLAVSEKQVYLIDELSDIDSIFPRLNPKANKLLLIEKDSGLLRTRSIEAIEQEFLTRHKTVFQDKYFYLVEI